MVASLFLSVSLAIAQDVYVGGQEKDAITGNWVGKIWKNGVEWYSYSEGTDIDVECMFVFGNDVYSATREDVNYYDYAAKIRKNETLLYSHPNDGYSVYVNSIYVSGNDVYYCGERGEGGKAVVWKNGAVLYTLANAIWNSGKQQWRRPYAEHIQVAGSDVYVGGYAQNSDGWSVAKVWKNGTEMYSLTPPEYTYYYAHSVFVQGNDVYLGGYSSHISSDRKSIVWKNGATLYSVDGVSSDGMYVLGSDVYVAGYVSEAAKRIGKVWKNEIELYTLTEEYGYNFKIFVFNGDVYVKGTEGNYSSQQKVWKNGVELYNFGNSNSKRINSLFVTSSSSAINDIKAENAIIKSVPDGIVIESVEPALVSVYNLFGQKVKQVDITGSTKITLDKGIYVVRIKEKSEKVIIR